MRGVIRRDIKVISHCTDMGRTLGEVQVRRAPFVVVVTAQAHELPRLPTGVSTPGLRLGLSIRKLE